MIVINLFAGPGCGKTTVAAEVFAEMKKARINCEYVPEKAKELTWEHQFDYLACQPTVFGDQLMRLWRLRNQVDMVVTDSPIMLSTVYAKGWPGTFLQGVVDINNSGLWDNWNYVLLRDDRTYQQEGRTQTREEAVSIDGKIQSLLSSNKMTFKNLPHSSVYGTATELIMRDIEAVSDNLKII